MDKLKQGRDLLKMRSQAKEMQKKLSSITESVESGKYHVKVSADQRIEFISIDGEESKDLKDAINEALRDWVTNIENTYYLIGSVVLMRY